MRQRTQRHQDVAERTVKDIRRKTRKRYSAEEKIRIVLAGLRGEDSIAELCHQEVIDEDGHGGIAFGALNASLDLEYGRSIVFFTRAGSTKWTKSTVQDRPNSSTTDRWRVSSPTISAVRPPSKPNQPLFQQPARAVE